MKHAFENMPSAVGFLLTEIPGHFSNSPQMRDEFKKLFIIMNPDRLEWDIPFQKDSKTRWLVRGKVLNKILINWKELLAYFRLIVQSVSAIGRYKGRTLIDMMSSCFERKYKFENHMS